ncbi:MAG: hypothetical protein J6T40_06935 [Clostridiales bacterium]|nr:hypothetical protein [Clostridiales bacterium]
MGDIRLNNERKMNPEEVRNCPKCGARLLSEVCQFCGTYIGKVATADLTPEYPLVECKSARLNFWNVGFPLLFGSIFALAIIPIFAASDTMKEADSPISMKLFLLPFILIGIGSISFALYKIFRILQVHIKGTVRSGVVYGYMDDTVAYNGVNGQKIKILLDTAEGKKFILLPLGTTSKTHEVNSAVDVKLYNKYAVILSKKTNW